LYVEKIISNNEQGIMNTEEEEKKTIRESLILKTD